jgi:hypothetical protein
MVIPPCRITKGYFGFNHLATGECGRYKKVLGSVEKSGITAHIRRLPWSVGNADAKTDVDMA